jgi:23S rRNA G2069 N7-methylase RlmK/C1962 C5-methylase RlmI
MSEVDFAAECQEAFRRLFRERAAIRLDEPGKRMEAWRMYERRSEQINDVLDQYNSWLVLNEELSTLL